MEKINRTLEKLISKKRGREYDVAVMYSGGKDSSYLLHLLKDVYKLRVLAVMVDNGFENDYMWNTMNQFAESVEIPVQIIRPGKENFQKLFNSLIVEHQHFKKEGINHLCFICNNFLWANVLKYAAENDIPYVASGLSLAQLNSGRTYPLNIDELANAIAEKSTKMICKNAIESMKNTHNYSENEEFKKFIDHMGMASKQITTIYPYIYHNLSVDELKKTLAGLNWTPPRPINAKEYISSGCMVMSKVVVELEKLKIVTLNEREQTKSMIDSGLISEDNLAFANYNPHNDIVDLSDELMNELKIRDYLLEVCKKEKRGYKIKE